MREADNIRAVAELGVDMMGFIFWPQSPRYVQMISSHAGIIPDYSVERLQRARQNSDLTSHQGENASELPKRVGVFVDEMPQTIVTRVYNYSLDYVQLHGQESRVMIENLRRTIDPDIRPGIKVIKAIGIAAEEDFKKCEEYEGVVDLFLFDTKTPNKGGSGHKFDWRVVSAYQGQTPFLLSGGIGPDDADCIRDVRHPLFAGVDLNSRFETEPGVKDVERLRTFLSALRS